MKANLYNMELSVLPEPRLEMGQFDPLKTPYEVDEGDFPRHGPLGEQFEFLVRYAILAPSSHNTQPWKFEINDAGIAVYADYTRRLPVADPDNRELLMSVGCAITNLRVAAAHFGFTCHLHYNYGGDSEGPLALLALTPAPTGDAVDRGLAELFAVLPQRRTNRQPFLYSRLPDSVLKRFQSECEGKYAATILSVDGRLNEQVAELVAAADRIQQADPEFRKELSEWVRTNYTTKGDGMRGASFGVKGMTSLLGPWATRRLDLGRMRAAADKNLCVQAPGLMVLYAEDGLASWLDTGELLERLLLTAVAGGLQYSFFNMLIQVPELRVELRKLLGLPAWPQLLLRVGYCLTEPARTPRRPLEEVLLRTSP